MTQEDRQEIENIMAEKMRDFTRLDKVTFSKHIQIFDGKNIQLGRGTGTKIGTEGYASVSDLGQKLGFFNKTPIVQQSHIADPVGGATVDAEARATINSILALLENFGFTRTS